jgi:Ser/Thr protein kinase RdoA (MazF antagonist)
MSHLDTEEAAALLVKLRAYLEKRYAVSISGLARLDRGVYRVDRRDGPSWVARVFPAERPLELVRGDAEVLRVLQGEGFPAERPASPEPASAPGGRPVLLTEYIEGAGAKRTVQTMKALGEMIGRLCTLPKRPGALSREAGALHHYSPAGGGPGRELEAAASWLDEADEKSPGHGRKIAGALRKQLSRADDCRGLPGALIHPDPVPNNLIATPADGLFLIDWTGAGWGPRLSSFALLIWSGAIGKDGVSMERVDAAVSGYSTHVRLTGDELARLAGAMRVRPLVFACWRYNHAVSSGMRVDGTEWWLPSEKIVEAIAGRARAGFERVS